MSRTNFEKDRIRKAAQFEQQFNKRTNTLRADLYREVLAYLNTSIKTDEKGRVLFSVSNIRASNKVYNTVQRFAKRKGGKLIKWLIIKLSELFKTNTHFIS